MVTPFLSLCYIICICNKIAQVPDLLMVTPFPSLCYIMCICNKIAPVPDLLMFTPFLSLVHHVEHSVKIWVLIDLAQVLIILLFSHSSADFT